MFLEKLYVPTTSELIGGKDAPWQTLSTVQLGDCLIYKILVQFSHIEVGTEVEVDRAKELCALLSIGFALRIHNEDAYFVKTDRTSESPRRHRSSPRPI